jgi:hypothetical protein
MKIYANENPIIRLKNGACVSLDMPAGEYVFSCIMGSESKIKILF